VRVGLLKCGTSLLSEGGRESRFSFVKSGLLAMRHTGVDGVSRIIGLEGRGLLAGQHAFHGLPTAITLQALSAVSVCEVPFALLDQDLRARAHYREALMRHNSRALSVLASWSHVVRMPALELRLAAALCLLAELQQSVNIEMPKQAVMAELLCVKRESVNRAYRNFQTRGIWQRLGPRQVALDAKALSRLLSASD
jgi:CRP-like cAMP-binding protein